MIIEILEHLVTASAGAIAATISVGAWLRREIRVGRSEARDDSHDVKARFVAQERQIHELNEKLAGYDASVRIAVAKAFSRAADAREVMEAFNSIGKSLTGVKGFLTLRTKPVAGTRMCPYCKEKLPYKKSYDKVAVCIECDTVHHTECYDRYGSCTIYGCESKAVMVGPTTELVEADLIKAA